MRINAQEILRINAPQIREKMHIPHANKCHPFTEYNKLEVNNSLANILPGLFPERDHNSTVKFPDIPLLSLSKTPNEFNVKEGLIFG